MYHVTGGSHQNLSNSYQGRMSCISYSYSYAIIITLVALYPGLLTPAFVACSTNVGEGLVKLSHVV